MIVSSLRLTHAQRRVEQINVINRVKAAVERPYKHVHYKHVVFTFVN
jgi:hypothetical protein